MVTTALAEALFLAHRERAQGWVTCTRAGRTSRLGFHDGALVALDLEFGHQSTAQALLAASRLGPDQLDALWARGEAQDPEPETLEELGLTPDEAEAVRVCGTVRALALQSEAVHFEAGEVAKTISVAGARVVRVAFELAGPPLEAPLRLRLAHPEEVAGWGLSEDEQAWLAGLEAGAPLGPLPPGRQGLVSLLARCGALEPMPEATLPEASPPERAGAFDLASAPDVAVSPHLAVSLELASAPELPSAPELASALGLAPAPELSPADELAPAPELAPAYELAPAPELAASSPSDDLQAALARARGEAEVESQHEDRERTRRTTLVLAEEAARREAPPVAPRPSAGAGRLREDPDRLARLEAAMRQAEEEALVQEAEDERLQAERAAHEAALSGALARQERAMREAEAQAELAEAEETERARDAERAAKTERAAETARQAAEESAQAEAELLAAAERAKAELLPKVKAKARAERAAAEAQRQAAKAEAERLAAEGRRQAEADRDRRASAEAEQLAVQAQRQALAERAAEAERRAQLERDRAAAVEAARAERERAAAQEAERAAEAVRAEQERAAAEEAERAADAAQAEQARTAAEAARAAQAEQEAVALQARATPPARPPDEQDRAVRSREQRSLLERMNEALRQSSFVGPAPERKVPLGTREARTDPNLTAVELPLPSAPRPPVTSTGREEDGDLWSLVQPGVEAAEAPGEVHGSFEEALSRVDTSLQRLLGDPAESGPILEADVVVEAPPPARPAPAEADTGEGGRLRRQRLLQRAIQSVGSPAPVAAGAAPAAIAAARVTSPTAVSAAPVSGTPSVPEQQLAVQIEARFEQLKRKDHFGVLGLDPGATRDQVRAAYLGLAKVFHPDRLPPALPHLAGKLSAVYESIRDAYDTLYDDSRRAAWIASRTAATGLQTPSESQQASELFKMGEAYFKKRDYRHAEEHFARAHALDRGAASLAAQAWAIYMDATRKTEGQAARAMMQQAIELDPACDRAHYQLGVIARVEGDMDRADGHFREAVRANPRHLEANQELRLIEMRRRKQRT